MQPLLPLVFALFFVLSFTCAVNGQQARVSGRVFCKDEGKPVQEARIFLFNGSDSMPSAQAATDELGRFGPLKADSLRFRMQVQAFGYDPVVQSFDLSGISQDTLLELGDWNMNPSSVLLDAVEITDRRIQTNLAGDTITFNAAAFGTHEDANIQDLLARMPGLELRGEDLYYNGVKIERILLDGKTYAGREALQALAYLPARVVDKIVVQQDKTAAQKDSGNLDPILELNIIRKEEYQTGVTGTATAGYGTDERYRIGGQGEWSGKRRRLTLQGEGHNINQTPEDQRQGGFYQQGIASPIGGRFSLNDSLGKHTALSLSSRFTSIERELSQRTNKLLFQQDGTALRRAQISDSPTHESYLSGHLEVETRFDSLRKLEMNVYSWMRGNRSPSFSSAHTANAEGVMMNRSETTNKLASFSPEVWTSFEYVQRWPGSQRRIELYGWGNYDGENRRNRFQSLNEYQDSLSFVQEELELKDTVRNRDMYAYLRARWVEPLGKHGELEFAYAYAPKLQWNRGRTWSERETDSAFDTLRSSDFRYEQFSHTPQAGYTYKKKWGSIAFQFQYTFTEWEMNQRLPSDYRLKRSWQLPRPQLTLNINLKPTGYLRFSYSTYFRSPEVSQLAAQIDFRDPLMLKQGDASLRPYFTHNLWVQTNWTNPKTERNFNFWGYFDLKPRPVVSSFYTQGSFWVGDSLIVLEPGQQLVLSEQHPWEASSWMNGSYGLRSNLLKSNFTWFFGNRFARVVNRIDGASNSSVQTQPWNGLKWSSQFGKRLAASMTYRFEFSYVTQTSLKRKADVNNTHSLSPALDWSFWPGWKLSADLNYRYNTALAQGLTPSVAILNAGVSYKFLKDFRGEAGLLCFDLLDRNRPSARDVQNNYIQDQETLAISRYVMFWFRYRFGKA